MVKRSIHRRKTGLYKRKTLNRDSSAHVIVGLIVILFVVIGTAGLLYTWVSNTMQAGGLGKETTPTAIWLAKPIPSGTYRPPDTKPEYEEPFELMFFEDHGANLFISTEDEPVSTFALDVDTASYTIARSYINRGYLPPKEAIRVEEFVNYFDDDYTPPKPEEDDAFRIHLEGGRSYFGGEDQYLLKIGIKARETSYDIQRDAVLTLAIDTSGSMDREDRLALVKKSVDILLDNLEEGDLIGVVSYSSTAVRVLDPTDNKSQIRDAVDQLTSKGSTNLSQGITLAYQMASEYFAEGKINHVILCSDGVANTGVTDPEAILEEVERYAIKGMTLNTFGFGMGNYNDELMESLADHGDGMYAYIDDYAEARRVFEDELEGFIEVVAMDAKAQVEFSPATVDRYRLLGYENRLLAEEDFENDSVDAGEVGVGQSISVLYELELKNSIGNAAKVGLRYTDPWTKDVEELNVWIETQHLRHAFEEASARFRFTTAVAQFAEILKESCYSANESLETLLPVVESAVADLKVIGLDTIKDHDFVDCVAEAIQLSNADSSEELEDSGPRRIISLTLTEGNLLLNELEVLISADGDSFYVYELTPSSLKPSADPQSEWNPGEALIISEERASPHCLDDNGRWKSEDAYVRIIYQPGKKMMYSSHVVIAA